MAAGAGASDAGRTAGASLAEAHAELLRTPGLQFDFEAFRPQAPPSWLQPLIDALIALGPVLKYVFWGGVILGAVLILWFAANEVMGLRLGSRRRVRVEAPDWRPDEARARALLEDADRLAGEGRFADAIHLLLFRSIDDLSGRRPGVVRPALTARDIARLDALPGEPRGAFARIAEVVERSFFGGRAVDADDFRAARADYEAFAFSGAWR